MLNKTGFDVMAANFIDVLWSWEIKLLIKSNLFFLSRVELFFISNFKILLSDIAFCKIWGDQYQVQVSVNIGNYTIEKKCMWKTVKCENRC